MWQGIFLPESTIRADSFTVSAHPRVQSHVFTSVRLLKILQAVHVTRVWWIIIISIIIYPLTARVVWALQMISQPVFSIFPSTPLPSWTCQSPGLSIPWCCLPTSSFVRLIFFLLSLCLARWFWPDLMNGRHDHATAVCVSLWSSGGFCVVQLPAGGYWWIVETLKHPAYIL